MRTHVRGWAVSLLLAACADNQAPGDDTGSDTTTGSSTPTTAASTMGTETSASTGVATSPTATSATTAPTTTPDETTSDVLPPDFPPPVPKYCDLESVDPEADPTMVIDAGDGPGQIPTIIGEALLRNCGCHYTDDVEGYVDYTTNVTPMDTHADFHATFAGIFPAEFKGMPVYLAVEQRVVLNNPLPMPSIECDVMGEFGTITEADRDLFADWLGAGAPDGATYPK
jgi:hypothetical protein